MPSARSLRAPGSEKGARLDAWIARELPELSRARVQALMTEAVVHGVPRARTGSIEAAIGRDPVHRKRMSVKAPRGRAARSSYTVVEPLDGASLLRVRIHTGRTHQIRVHLASIGHPVAGDATYGGTRTPSSRRAAAREALTALRRP